MLCEDCRGYGEDGAEGLGWRGGMGLRGWEETTNGLRGLRVGLEGAVEISASWRKGMTVSEGQ